VSRDGFERADIDTMLHSDPKVVALARRLRESGRTMAAVGVYTGLVLASWRAGQRVTLEESLPAWWIDPFDELAADLTAVGLIDDEQRIPIHAWESWFKPANDRRQTYRDKARLGGLRAGGNRSAEEALELLEQRGLQPPLERGEHLPSTRPPGRPSNQPAEVVSFARAREGALVAPRGAEEARPSLKGGMDCYICEKAIAPGQGVPVEPDDSGDRIVWVHKADCSPGVAV
jgi:hypothetical protein